ncbi:MAG TPA: BrnT family toxin [Sphingomicrobium sp.]|nr:BrnT family toxin [Sphingomicrobium sp.]
MEITYDPEKRAKALAERGLDFEDAVQVFAGPRYTVVDDRRNYGELRYQTYGLLNDRLVMIVWTPRGEVWHIISMRKCNEREKEEFEEQLGRSG